MAGTPEPSLVGCDRELSRQDAAMAARSSARATRTTPSRATVGSASRELETSGSVDNRPEPQPVEPNAKVTIAPRSENKQQMESQLSDTMSEDVDSNLEFTESRPQEQQPPAANDESTDSTTPKPSNGAPKSYAAVVAENHDNEQDGTSKPEVDGVDSIEKLSYPPLPTMDEIRNTEQQAYNTGGIRFAPLRVPMTRRLQTAAVLFHCMSIGLSFSIFWLICANPLTWPILVPYLIHLLMSSAATNGTFSYRSERMRSLRLWKLFAGYFPAKLHKTHDLDPKRKYILGYHPHGIISHGAWVAFATNALGFKEMFPGITNALLTLDSNFRLPFYRDWILAMGLQSVSKESIWNILTKGGPNGEGQGRAVTIVVGGARESLEAQPGTLRLILKGRKGFVKMALRTGADLVPVIGFGENDLYDQLSPKTHPMVHKIQMFLLKVFKFTLPALHGRGVLNYDVGLMPYRRPVNIVVGKPIEVNMAHGAQPAQEDIDRLHELYVEEVERLWNTYKDHFAAGRKSEMQIIA